MQPDLLEKSRLVGLAQNERNYHIFYEITGGAPQSLKGKKPPSFLLPGLVVVEGRFVGLQRNCNCKGLTTTDA